MTLAAFARRRKRAQKIGALALVPFVGMLVWHGMDHSVPLFLASFAGFIVALLGIIKIPKMRALALREADTSMQSIIFCSRFFFPSPY